MSNVIEFSVKAIDNFSSVMEKSRLQISETEKTMLKLGIAAAVAGGVMLAKRSLENADAMGAMAERASISTEAMSALAFAAKMSNTETATLATGIKMLGKAMAEGDASPAGQSLKGLGISAKDVNGVMRSTTDVFLDVADAFANTKNDANKTKVAMELMGRGGAEMAPLLNKGGDAIRALMGDAKRLGLVITDDFSASADAVNDNLGTMASIVEGSVNKAMVVLAPTLEMITGQMVELAGAEGNVEAAGRAFASGIRVIISGGTILFAVFEGVGKMLGGVAASLALLASGEFSQAMTTMKNTTVDLGTTIGETAAKVTQQWDDTAQSAAGAAAKQASAARAAMDSMNSSAAEQLKAQKELEKAESDRQTTITKTITEMRKAADTVGMSAEQIKLYELSLLGASTAEMTLAAQAVLIKTSFDDATKATEAHNTAVAAAQALIEGQQSPLEQHVAKLEQINSLKAEGALTTEQSTQAIQRENEAWEAQRVKLDEYKQTVTEVMTEAGRMLTEQFQAAGSVAYQTAEIVTSATNQLIKGVGDSVAAAVMEGANLGKALENVMRNVVKNVISMLVQMGIQRIVLALISRSTAATEASASMAAGLGSVYLNSFASAAAIPFVGWSIAPGIATANTAIAGAGAIASMSTGAGIGMMAGAAHGGLDYVPAESTYLLDKGERVLSPRQNSDLTSFMNSGGNGGGVSIGNLTIHVLENATNVDAFARMDKVALRNALGQPVVDALNEMFSLGIRPNFAMQATR